MLKGIITDLAVGSLANGDTRFGDGEWKLMDNSPRSYKALNVLDAIDVQIMNI